MSVVIYPSRSVIEGVSKKVIYKNSNSDLFITLVHWVFFNFFGFSGSVRFL